MKVGIRMVDGTIVSGDDWSQVETQWANLFMNQLIPADQFRAEVQNRARVWSGTDIAVDGTSYDFLQECERAGMLTTITNVDAVDPNKPAAKPASRVVFLDAVRHAAEQRRARRATQEG